MTEKEIYVKLEIKYIEEMGRKIEDDNRDLFPLSWYSILDYNLKIEILYEAISKKIKIINTNKYLSSCLI